jgi:hypothetical protein
MGRSGYFLIFDLEMAEIESKSVSGLLNVNLLWKFRERNRLYQLFIAIYRRLGTLAVIGHIPVEFN